MDRVPLEFHGSDVLTENDSGIEGLRVGALSWQAMLEKKSPRFAMFFRFYVGIDLRVVHPYDFLAHDDEIFPLVLLNQLVLVVFKVLELLLQHRC